MAPGRPRGRIETLCAVLSRTYGGHLLVVGGETLLVDDAHHHDEPPGHEIHFHEGTHR